MYLPISTFFLALPLLTYANPLPEPEANPEPLDTAALVKRASCGYGYSATRGTEDGCNNCVVNAREGWAYDNDGQQFRRCWFSMVESTDGTVQKTTDLQNGAEMDVSWDNVYGYDFMKNHLGTETDTSGRTGGPWCTKNDPGDKQGFCTTAWYKVAWGASNSGNACQKSLQDWQKYTGCRTG